VTENKKAINEIKKRLRAVWYCQRRIDRNNERLQRLRSKAEKMTTSFSDAPGGSGPGDRVGEYAALIIDMETAILQDSKDMWQTIKETEILISTLDDYQERLVLQLRYCDCRPLLDIALSLNYDVRTIYRIHGRALMNLVTKCQLLM
jgi:hypothetical protein